jgi:hypothetical protein
MKTRLGVLVEPSELARSTMTDQVHELGVVDRLDEAIRSESSQRSSAGGGFRRSAPAAIQYSRRLPTS